MPTGPAPKGPRLWLQPARQRPNGSIAPAVWVIRDDGGFKRSTGCAAGDRGQAERALAAYLAERHTPDRRKGDPSEVATLDILTQFARDIVPGYARPKEAAARIKRLGLWWGQPAEAMRTMRDRKIPHSPMTGAVSDVRTATCQAYVAHVGKTRTASMDLELLRAAINHGVKEQILDRTVPVALPERSMPRERWLTRSEVATLVWTAWRRRRVQDGEADEWKVLQHIARFMVVAHYTGTRKSAILSASFRQEIGKGFIDLKAGLWHRQPLGKRRTNKRQPAIPLPAPLQAHMRRWAKNGQLYPVEFHGGGVDRIDKAFRKLVRDCGFEGDVVIHTFRHTAITWAMQRAMDPWAASGYFGINLQTLISTYGHHHPDHLREAAKKMARPAKIAVAGDRVRQD